MRNPPAAFKHADPTHLDFGKSADSSLLAKKRRNFADGGDVATDLGMDSTRPGDVTCAKTGFGGGADPGVPWCGSPENLQQVQRQKALYGEK